MEDSRVQMFIPPVTLETQVCLEILTQRASMLCPPGSDVADLFRDSHSTRTWHKTSTMNWRLWCPTLSLYEDDIKEHNTDTVSMLQEMTGDHEGVYYPLTGMSKDVQQQLIDDHFLFKVYELWNIFGEMLSLFRRKETGSSRLPMPADTGQQDEESSTTTARHSWCGAGRRTTSGSSACRWVAMLARCSRGWRRVWRR